MLLLWVWLWYYRISWLTPSNTDRRWFCPCVWDIRSYSSGSINALYDKRRSSYYWEATYWLHQPNRMRFFLCFKSLRLDLRITFRFTLKCFATLFMTSHLEATKAAAPMDSVPFQDGIRWQASVLRPFQSSLPDGFCCHDECAISRYICHRLFRSVSTGKKKEWFHFIIIIALTSVYVSTLVN